MKFWLIILSVFLPVSLFSQTSKQIDSLQSILISTSNSAEKITLHYQLARALFLAGKADEALSNANKALEIIAIEPEHQSRRPDLYFLIGQVHEQNKQSMYALQYYLRSLPLFEKQNAGMALSENYFRVANLCFSLEIYNKALIYSEKAFARYEIEKNTWKQIELKEQQATTYNQTAQPEKALECYKWLISIYDKLKLTKLKISTQKNYATQLCLVNQTAEALNENTKLLAYFQTKADSASSVSLLNNMAFIYMKQGSYDKARHFFEKCLKLDNSPTYSSDRAILHQNIAICYQNTGRNREAILNLQNALDIRQHQNNLEEIATINNLIALVFFYQTNYLNAEDYSSQSILFAKKLKNKELLKHCYQTHSRILQQENDIAKSTEYYKLFAKLRDSLDLEKRLREQKIIEMENSFEKIQKDIQLVAADEEKKDLELKQLKLETEKKEQQLKLLTSENALKEQAFLRQQQDLLLEKQKSEAELRKREISELQHQQELQEAKLKEADLLEKERQTTIEKLELGKKLQDEALKRTEEQKRHMAFLGLLFFIIFILILIGLLLTKKKNMRLRKQQIEINEKNAILIQKNEEILAQSEELQKANTQIQEKNEFLQQKQEEILAQNEEITVQKEEIEHKNKSITSSINYASRIQHAVLPLNELSDITLFNHFIFFQPRDIVSGDFFWYKEIERKNKKYHIFTVADCTGHGVPGAFMSLLGIAFLNEIAANEDIEQPAEILNELRKKVKTSLHQTDQYSESKDGMDISLCRIDLHERKLQYAGANNPLYLVRHNNDKAELIEIKADKMPIGVHLREKDKFTNHEVELQANDMVYLCSDGFQDQFGGPQGDKYKSKRLRELFLFIHSQSETSQREHIIQEFENWRSFNEQVDDVLVMGIRIL